jgi:hypothetical protein
MSLDINDGRVDDGAFERIEGKRLTYRPTSWDRSSQAGRETIGAVLRKHNSRYTKRDVMNLLGGRERRSVDKCLQITKYLVLWWQLDPDTPTRMLKRLLSMPNQRVGHGRRPKVTRGDNFGAHLRPAMAIAFPSTQLQKTAEIMRMAFEDL